MSNAPIKTLRDGNISASIWKNDGEKGAWYSVEFQRTYTDQSGEVKNATSFSGDQLLRLARLSGKAYDAVAELRAADKS